LILNVAIGDSTAQFSYIRLSLESQQAVMMVLPQLD
jgi:hypothetical protein